MDNKTKTGKFFIIGVGPGDPDLITVKGRRILSEVDVIFAPHKSAGHRSLARTILNGTMPKCDQQEVDLVFPMKRGEESRPHWEEAASIIWEYLEKGKDCAFIIEGDPMLYGTSSYILSIFETEHPEVEIEIIPGISSVTASAACAKLPLASGGERVAILPAIYQTDVLEAALENFDTVVLMKVHKKLQEIRKVLQRKNPGGRTVYVRQCTTENEEVVWDMSKLCEQEQDYFSIVISRRRNAG